MRVLDTEGVDAIVAEPVSDVGLGSAIMDRLRRAAFRGD
jgi:L-threonylcarbamoyladenylate synthase